MAADLEGTTSAPVGRSSLTPGGSGLMNDQFRGFVAYSDSAGGNPFCRGVGGV